ncbi:uncharacterized protein LOC110598734 isoform X2 [Ictidomys tridecemlineatus]|uniref:uncharacterized protein LOC110598734 n=1 Tax=Ictidomys tridecemlineatus TaxID=43179 RepID=UPI000B53A2F8|nr:uncharacterized protein LOC110598734 [Ictidomys tridecemlineatus]
MGPLEAKPRGVGRAGGAPCVSAVPVGRALRGAPTQATFKVNHPWPASCPSPASRHLSQWHGAGGGRGTGGGKTLLESLSLHSVESQRLRAERPPASLRLRGRRQAGAPCSTASRALVPGCILPAARRRLLLRWPGRGLSLQTCHPTPRKRAAPSRLLFVPLLGSALGRRLLLPGQWRLGAPPWPNLARLKFHPSGPLQTWALFFLVLPVWTPRGAGRRQCAQPRAGAGAAELVLQWEVGTTGYRFSRLFSRCRPRHELKLQGMEASPCTGPAGVS